MKVRLLASLVAAFVAMGCFLGSVSTPAGAAPQDALAARVAALEKALSEERAARELTGQREKALASRVAAIESWLATLPGAAKALDAQMLAAREWGFEAAGPNPRAKTAVLEGLRAFGRDIARRLPPSSAPVEVETEAGSGPAVPAERR